jgi:hypothetical protein
VCGWTLAEELSGRREFDAWRFARVDRTVPWDWADIGTAEKRQWIERARRDAETPGPDEGCPDRRAP